MRMEDGGKAVRYECTRCGACCRWAGDVCVETDEIREISRFLDMDEQVFIDTCCRLRANRIVHPGRGRWRLHDADERRLPDQSR